MIHLTDWLNDFRFERSILMNIIETKALTKFYGKSRGIKNISLSVEQGDFFGFIGPNGAGKSTTIRLLLGLISPTSGSASVLGLDCTKNKTEILKRVGYMPGESAFYNLRAKDVIKMSADLRRTDCSAEAQRLCELFEVDVNKPIRSLSLGNKKKVSIVCAMQHRPELYIFDEPTSGLDPLMQKRFFDEVSARRNEGATVFLSTHILPEIQAHCINAAIVREGEIIKQSTISELTRGSTKRVQLRSVFAPPEIEGIKDVKSTEDGVSFLYSGEAALLAAEIGKMPVSDFTVSEPELEEIFMHYYEREGENR